VDWLSSLHVSLNGPLPPPSPSTARPKRKPEDQPSLAQRRVRAALGSTAPREPTRRSTRSNTATVTHDTPPQAQETPPPSPLAASHGHFKPRFAQAFARLYGTTQHRGIIASMTILRLYCQCLGATWNSRSSDPVVFFRTPDMADASQWPPLPPGFDRRLPKAFAFTRPEHARNPNSDRSAGLGPVHGVPP
jgi:hypothetical protein